MRREGFTLVEMLIALAIFGLLTAAGVTLLSVTARTQQSADRQLQRHGAVRTLGALMTADLAQAARRPHRGADGRGRPAFSGRSGGEALLLFVRQSVDSGDGGAPRRIGYRLRDGRLERLSFAHVDGDSPAVAALLLDGVSALRLRFRDSDGGWRDDWSPTDPLELPVAVELVTASADHGLVRQLFLVGSGPR